MADGLIDILQPRLPLVSNIVRTNDKYKWIKIYDMRDTVNSNWTSPTHNTNNNSVFEVKGNKANLKVEKLIEREYMMKTASIVLQRNVRYK